VPSALAWNVLLHHEKGNKEKNDDAYLVEADLTRKFLLFTRLSNQLALFYVLELVIKSVGVRVQ